LYASSSLLLNENLLQKHAAETALRRLSMLAKKYVKNARLHFSQNAHGLNFAAISVSAVTETGLGEVWNLSVEDVHEYVANGVVVNNCLRNAAMRFGAGLELWHKGELHIEEPVDQPKKPDEKSQSVDFKAAIEGAASLQELSSIWQTVPKHLQTQLAGAKDTMKTKLEKKAA
jgi:hypothetical protein